MTTEPPPCPEWLIAAFRKWDATTPGALGPGGPELLAEVAWFATWATGVARTETVRPDPHSLTQFDPYDRPVLLIPLEVRNG